MGERGFTLIEVVVGMALIAVAVLGLAQLFALCVAQNMRADRMANATFLAQQQIDSLRDLTGSELSALGGSPIDEQLDVNYDNTYDFRRITLVQFEDVPSVGSVWKLKVMVFSPEQFNVNVNQLLADPVGHKVKAYITTMISR